MATCNSTQLPPRVKDEAGNVYSKLTVLECAELRSPEGAFWLCRCECGNLTTVNGSNLRKGNTKSCGCLHYRANGGSGTPEHRIWKDMKRRCYNPRRPDYYLYGGRGITMCDRWRKSFVNFLADMGLKPFPEATIERVDNNGPYAPENCVWATRLEQARNKRTARLITYKGETKSLREWSQRAGVLESTIYYRLKRGVPAEQLFLPTR